MMQAHGHQMMQQNMMMKSGWSLPKSPASISDLIAQAHLMNAPITKEAITNPKPDIVRNYILDAMRSLQCITDEELSGAQLPPQTPPEFANAFQESILLRRIMRFCHATGYTTFSSQDIHHPDPSRWRMLLTHIFFFGRFRESALNDLYVPMEELFMMSRDIESLVTKCDQLKDALTRQNAICTNESDQVRVESKIVEELSDEVRALKAQCELTTGLLENKKKVAADLLDQITQETTEVHKVKANTDNLRRKIIEHPEALPRRVAELEDEVKKLKESWISLEKRTKELSVNLENVGSVKIEAEKTEKSAEELRTLKARLSETEKNIKQASEEYENSNKTLAELKILEQSLDRKCVTLQERIDKLNVSHSESRSEEEARLNELRREYSQKTSDRASVQAEIEACEEEMDKIRLRLKDEQTIYDSRLMTLKTDFSTLSSQLSLYNDSLRRSMNVV